jgi:hypothetical protein
MGVLSLDEDEGPAALERTNRECADVMGQKQRAGEAENGKPGDGVLRTRNSVRMMFTHDLPFRARRETH